MARPTPPGTDRSTAVTEETYLSVVAARDLETAVRLTERALLTYDDMVEVLAIDPSATLFSR
jgi:hypothetical protein